ncbi:MAG: DivIVA domain-containing protein [Actinomycetota bacterium]
MAQDFDLPLFASADQIRRREFVATRRGYDPDQVRAYLEQLADQIEQLEGMVRDARQRADASSAPQADPYQEVASRVAGAIRAADESAQRLVADAQGKVEELLAAARS